MLKKIMLIAIPHIFVVMFLIPLCILATRGYRLERDGVEIQATIIEIRTTTSEKNKRSKEAIIEYYNEAYGRNIETPLNSWDSTMFVGKPLTIYVDEEDPTNVVVKGEMTTFVIILICSITVVFTADIFLIRYLIKSKQKKNRLNLIGVRIKAQVNDIAKSNTTVNGVRYYVISTTAIVDDTEVIFTSYPLPPKIAKSSKGITVEILYNPLNYEEYEFIMPKDSEISG